MLGPLLYACGAFLFYPAAQVHTYWLFLLALFVIASGLAFLETTANPLVTVLGPADGAARRLNLAQAFNPLGSITGVLVGQHFIFSGVEHTPAELAAMAPAAREAFFATESAAVQMPYLIIGAVVVLWAILIALVRFPAARRRQTPALRPGAHASANCCVTACSCLRWWRSSFTWARRSASGVI